MDKYLIWGTGNYCKEKIDYFDKNSIVGIVDRKKELFLGYQTILPLEINNYNWDYIVVFSSHIFDIIAELIGIGVTYNRIIPGMIFRPYSYSELEYMSSNVTLTVTRDGFIEYNYRNLSLCIKSEKDWNEAKNFFLEVSNSEKITKLSVEPVGKYFGINRGGSIIRYYIDLFLRNNIDCITGNILEVGDAGYTKKYGKGNSYVLVYKNDNKNNQVSNNLDTHIIKGNIETGEGMIDNFFDCIIMTQVLNFIYDVFEAVDNITNSLKIGGWH